LGVFEELTFLIFLPFGQICGNSKAVFNVSAPKQNIEIKASAHKLERTFVVK